MTALACPASLKVIERGWLSSNNIVFTGRHETAVVDTGYGRHAAQTTDLIAHALGGRPLDRIVNTHTHSDHIGGNAALRRAHPAVLITIPTGDADLIRQWDETALHLTPMGQECARFAHDAAFGPGDTLTLGDLAWRAIASPGHDASSQMLFCAEHGILISADALWQNGFGVIFSEVDGDAQGRAFAAQRATLDAIASLDIRWVIPGHGAPFADVPAALERAYGRIDHFIAHPERHARNALKVLLAFLLMMEGRIALASLPTRFAALPMAARINADYYRLDATALAEFAASALEHRGAAYRTGGWLVAETQ